MQLTDIRTRVRERLGLSTTDTAVTDAILTQLVNTAIRKIDLMHDWPWLVALDATLIATVAGQTDYTPAATWRKTLYVVADKDQQLVYKQEKDLARFSTLTGYPSFYTIEGGTMRLSPEPDAVYDIRHVYVGVQPALTLDTDEPDTHDWAIDSIIELTAVLVAARLRDRDLYKVMDEQWGSTLLSLRDEIRRTRQMPTAQHRTDIGWG